MLHITGETNHTLTLAEHEHLPTIYRIRWTACPCAQAASRNYSCTYEGRAVDLKLRII